MHPILLRLGPVEVSSYGLLLGLSFILGAWLAAARAGRKGLSPRLVVDASLWIVLAAMVCARLYYIALNAAEFRGAGWSRLIPLFGPGGGMQGLSVTGGFIGGVLACFLFLRHKRIQFLPYADAIAPSLGLGAFLTRIGCFLNGCCYGRPTRAWYGLAFPPESPAGHYQSLVHAPRLFPTQLLLSVGGLAVLAATLIADKRSNKPGPAFGVMGMTYSAVAFIVDFLRSYPRQERLGPLTYTQVFSLPLFLAFAGLLLLKARRPEAGD